ncbi:ribonuclease H [Sesbania bispinosa]|nr:ribonuclease H [Sesbania bispinosa]
MAYILASQLCINVYPVAHTTMWVTLAQSCIYSITSYILQGVVIPVSTCDEIEKICRDFIWGSSQGQRKCHLISWEKICKPNEEGGLSFRSLRVLNEAYLLKLAWNILFNPDLLWVQPVKAKYRVIDSTQTSLKAAHKDSILWKGISRVWHHLGQCTSWILGDGRLTKF